MSNTADTITSRHRLATESQLLAEERWLLHALKKIAQQRNSLQIEKLQLKYHLSKLQAQDLGESHSKEADNDNHIKPEHFKASLVELTRQKDKLEKQEMEDELLCNSQTLNLNVNPDMYSMGYLNMQQQENFMEEEEEVDEEDDYDENMLNMFIMNK